MKDRLYCSFQYYYKSVDCHTSFIWTCEFVDGGAFLSWIWSKVIYMGQKKEVCWESRMSFVLFGIYQNLIRNRHRKFFFEPGVFCVWQRAYQQSTLVSHSPGHERQNDLILYLQAYNNAEARKLFLCSVSYVGCVCCLRSFSAYQSWDPYPWFRLFLQILNSIVFQWLH